ncbi:MAG TPA: hypothetical protein VK387_02300, partial [Thermoleophilaceae bacterium]|nr:hypothetical protein [Thermoleophilaceae bacterium]
MRSRPLGMSFFVPGVYFDEFTIEGCPPADTCTIRGTPRNETIRGTSRADVICAGDGNDIVYGLGGND